MRTVPWKEAQGLQVLPAEFGDCLEGTSARGLCFLLRYLIGGQGGFDIRFHLERKCPLV